MIKGSCKGVYSLSQCWQTYGTHARADIQSPLCWHRAIALPDSMHIGPGEPCVLSPGHAHWAQVHSALKRSTLLLYRAEHTSVQCTFPEFWAHALGSGAVTWHSVLERLAITGLSCTMPPFL